MYRIILVSIVFLGIFASCRPDKSSEKSPPKKVEEVVSKDTTAVLQKDKFGIPTNGLEVANHKVKRNESLYLILDQLDFNPHEIYKTSQKAEDVVGLDQFKPGQQYRVYSSADSTGQIKKILWQPNELEYIVFDWTKDSVSISRAARPLRTKQELVSGTIQNSLYKTIHRQGSSPLLAYKLAEIYAWQINFFGLRPGDSFKVLYNKKFVGDEFIGAGKILASRFVNRGEEHNAYSFRHGEFDGYFDEEGQSVEKALLKAPFEYNHRISSGYSSRRLHPILKKYKAHYGVDYAAATGTPVIAVGEGTVTEAQYRGANGNIVKIKHNDTYRTAYLHLRGFADGIHRGASVEQGQVIGYVGSTGRSTGPHLDYRLYKNNRPVNSQRIDLPSSKDIPDSLMKVFKEKRASFMRQLQDDKAKQKLTTLAAGMQCLVPLNTASKK